MEREDQISDQSVRFCVQRSCIMVVYFSTVCSTLYLATASFGATKAPLRLLSNLLDPRVSQTFPKQRNYSHLA